MKSNTFSFYPNNPKIGLIQFGQFQVVSMYVHAVAQ